jgi:filamentous hemagglutinin family protein
MVRRLRLLALIGCLGTVPVYAAGPSGGIVSAGSATITQSAAQTTIKQTSDKAVVNWNNFSIGSGSTVRFVQPSASSIALNRVTGSQASVIQGALQANGQVWVLNPNGVLIAPGGQVAAGSFLATTRSLTDQQFMAGNYAFTDGGVPGASVVNQGSIIVAEGGYAVLAGEAVRNEGYIEANLGQVVLGGAKAFTLDLSGDNTLAFVVTAPVDVTPTDGKAVVDNSGSIQAAGGRVLMTARAASQVVGQVINTGGVVAATSAQMVNGKIVLDGGTGSVSVAGNLNASGKGAGQTGGAIDVNAQKIQVKATAKLDVTGDAGGGKIAIGGGGPGTRTQSFTPAESTTIAAGARLDASALTRGDGGEILVFTSLTNPIALTQVAGSLIARGGSQGGNGGFIETSGYRLDVSGIVVSTNAPKGRLGLWLLDPDSIEIGAFETSGGCTATDMTGVGCTRLDAAALSAALNGGGGFGSSIEVSATNSILVSAPISWNSTGTLTLTASGTSGAITVNAAISNDGPTGGLKLYAKTIDINARIALAAGSLIVNDKGAAAGSRFTIGSAGEEPHVAQNIGIQADIVEINGAMTATDAFTITDASTVTIAGTVRANVITVSAPLGFGTITVEQPMVSRDTLELNAGTLISITTNELTSNNAGEFVLGTTTLTAPQITFASNVTQTGILTATATTSIRFATDDGGTIIFEGDGDKSLIAPEIIWGARAVLGNGDLRLQTPQLTWLTNGRYTGGTGGELIIGGVDKTTITSPENVSLTAKNITINNELAWSGFGLTLTGVRTEGAGGFVTVKQMTGTGGATLAVTIPDGGRLQAKEVTGLIALSGTPAPGKFASFTYNTSEADVGPSSSITPPGVGGLTVTVTNTADAGGGGGGSSSGSSDTPVVIVTPTTTTTSTTAAAAAAKAAADAAAAQAIADAAAATAAALDTTTKVVVEQAIAQAVATVVASTSAAVFVAPAPPPPATSTTSGASTTTATDTTATSSSASTSTTTTAATTTTSAATSTTTTTTATTATAAATTSTAQGTTVTQEFVEPLSVATLSSTTSTVSDPGDTSAATTSATSGPASQTATPASTASAAPAAPALTPVAVSKDGADAGDFTLQTVKPPAPVTAAKQQARPTERVTTTSVSPGIALQATQKTPAPSGSVLGREISGSGNSSNW